MDPFDPADPDATPPSSARPTEPLPLHIDEATTPPVLGDSPPYRPYEPTAVLPVQPTTPPRVMQQPVPTTPVVPPYVERRYVPPEQREAWPYVLAVFALLLGAVGGYLLATLLDDDDDVDVATAPPASVIDGSDMNGTLDMLLARTRTDGEYRTPSEFPQLDEITEIDSAAATADLQNQVALLTTAQDESAERVTVLETELAEVTAERDALAAQVDESGETDTQSQTQLDAANERIATLEAELETARTDLDTATAELRTARADLDAANAQLEQLNVTQVPNYVNADAARARSDAAANGWQLIEVAEESGSPAGTVVSQSPASGANMVRGSVLYIAVAENA